jgi:hypothetical protein
VEQQALKLAYNEHAPVPDDCQNLVETCEGSEVQKAQKGML